MLIHNADITGSLLVNGTGYNTGSFSGSFIGTVAGTTATASYVEYNNVANKPALVSGSSQITYSGLTGIPSGIVSGSSQVTYSGLTGIPSGIVSGSSQVTYSGLSGIPSGIVSGSSQVTYSGLTGIPSGIVSGSSQVTYSGLSGIPSGILSGSAQIAAFGYATTGSNGFNGNQSITGSLTVTGQVVAQTLNVQQVTSSIVFSSGSNIFGNSLANTQQFTGSLQVTGSSHYLLGNVGIGTTSPNVPLEIQADSGGTAIRIKARAAANSGTLRFFNNASSTQLAKVESSDNSFEIGSLNNVFAAFLTNATERMRITADGDINITGRTDRTILNVGNSSTIPNNAAGRGNIVSNGSSSAIIQLLVNSTEKGYFFHGGTDSELWNTANGYLRFGTNNTERIRITSGGNVLIGTTTDDGSRLRVNGVISISPITSAPTWDTSTRIWMEDFFGSRYDGFQHRFDVGSSRTQALLINSSGAATFSSSVAANSLLVERAASRNMLGISTVSLPTSGDEEGVAVIKTNSTLWQLSTVGYAVDSKGVRFYNNGGVGYTAFEVAQAGGTRFIVNGVGNVGIGTNNPDTNSRLDVNGQAFVARLALYNNNGTPSLGTSPMLYSPASGNLAISTNTSERLRITHDGYVGIGTTSPANYLTIGTNTAGDSNPYSMSILRNGTTVSPGTWLSTPAINVTDIAGDGPSSVSNTNAILQLNLPRVGDVDTFANNAFFINCVNDNGSAFVVTGRRNVGIGTTNPTSKLTIAPPNVTNASTIEFTNTDNAVISSHFNLVLAVNNTNAVAGRAIAFAKGGKGYGDQASTMMTILADSGNVLIGTTSDNGSRLQVSGAVSITPSSSLPYENIGSNPFIRRYVFNNGNMNAGQRIRLSNTTNLAGRSSAMFFIKVHQNQLISDSEANHAYAIFSFRVRIGASGGTPTIQGLTTIASYGWNPSTEFTFTGSSGGVFTLDFAQNTGFNLATMVIDMEILGAGEGAAHTFNSTFTQSTI